MQKHVCEDFREVSVIYKCFDEISVRVVCSVCLPCRHCIGFCMRFSVLVDFVCGFAVLDEIFFGFAVSNIPQCPPHTPIFGGNLICSFVYITNSRVSYSRLPWAEQRTGHGSEAYAG